MNITEQITNKGKVRSYTSNDLAKFSLYELRALARAYSVRSYTRLKKVDVIKALLKIQKENGGTLPELRQPDYQDPRHEKSIKTPEDLRALFAQFYEEKAFEPVEHYDTKGNITHVTQRRHLLTINGFGTWLTLNGHVTFGNQYLHQKLGEEMQPAWRECKEIMRCHWEEATANGDVVTAFGIFHGKNAYKMSDRVEAVNTNVETKVEYSAEEVEKLKKIALGGKD